MTGVQTCALPISVPLLDYTITGQDGQLLVTDAESLPIPEFDNIGMEVLPMTQILNSSKAPIANLFNAGYNPRYFNWKTKLDVINGAFTTTLKAWASPVTASLLSGWFGFGYDEDDANNNTKVVLNYKFFKVNPSILDPIIIKTKISKVHHHETNYEQHSNRYKS